MLLVITYLVTLFVNLLFRFIKIFFTLLSLEQYLFPMKSKFCPYNLIWLSILNLILFLWKRFFLEISCFKLSWLFTYRLCFIVVAILQICDLKLVLFCLFRSSAFTCFLNLIRFLKLFFFVLFYFSNFLLEPLLRNCFFNSHRSISNFLSIHFTDSFLHFIFCFESHVSNPDALKVLFVPYNSNTFNRSYGLEGIPKLLIFNLSR